MKTLKQQIIDEWNKTIEIHPSYRSIAKKVGVDHSYVFRIINQHKQNKNENKNVVTNQKI
jgi:phage regulator Rha-like protein